MNVDEAAFSIYQFRNARIERELIRQIEIIEGRVPSNGDIKKHALCLCYPNGDEEWTWKRKPIVRITPCYYKDGKSLTFDLFVAIK